MDKVTVSADALRKVLSALNAPEHWYLQELQHARKPEIIFKDNPINILTREFNEQTNLMSRQPPDEISGD